MINELRSQLPKIIVAGLHAPIIQSVLDFDYLAGKSEPSIVAILSGGRKFHKCRFGKKEILLPVFSSLETIAERKFNPSFLLNIASANSARRVTEEFFKLFPSALGAHLFAEGVREYDAVALIDICNDYFVAGPSGVGLLVPRTLKLGAIGGISGSNVSLLARRVGEVAVVCSSGGMVNELIDTLLRHEQAPSFAVSYGGDRFPLTSPLQWCLEAEADSQTRTIVYFGELGGTDEYALAEAIQNGSIKKPVLIYIAGHYKTDKEAIQFGHAKALVKNQEESVTQKNEALKNAGAIVCESYQTFIQKISMLPKEENKPDTAEDESLSLETPRASLFTATRDRGSFNDSFVKHLLCTLLGKENISPTLESFTDSAFSILVDHGAEVSGAVNTMVTARAGKDMSSSVASGILTIGDRFGGAVNDAAMTWYEAVQNKVSVENLLETHKRNAIYVPGIGHKKYTAHTPDPRVKKLHDFLIDNNCVGNYTTYALSVENRTVAKKASLILNIDGMVAAALLDILTTHDNYSNEQLQELISCEFFNSFFLIPRTVGFVGNYLSQKKNDEGLFRLPEDEVFYL